GCRHLNDNLRRRTLKCSGETPKLRVDQHVRAHQEDCRTGVPRPRNPFMKMGYFVDFHTVVAQDLHRPQCVPADPDTKKKAPTHFDKYFRSNFGYDALSD